MEAAKKIISMYEKNQAYIPKEISWLSFNHRVLQEADNPKVPLIERIRFLGIYSNNLDEFFRVRVATIKRLAKLNSESYSILGYNAADTLKEITRIVLVQRKYYENIYKRIIEELEKEKIIFKNENNLSAEQDEFVSNYFRSRLKPILMPFFIRKENSTATLKDDAIYFGITITPLKASKKIRYAIMEVPTRVLPRFIILPSGTDETNIIFLDDIIRHGLKELFSLFKNKEISAHTIKVNKDAELDIIDDISESYMEIMSKSLSQRKTGNPVRFLYDRDIPVPLLKLITDMMQITEDDALLAGGRYHNLKDLINFPDPGIERLKYRDMPKINHPDFDSESSILSNLRKKDILIYYPYHSFDTFIDLLRESSIDPAVKEIYITLYRIGKGASVVNALTNAVRNGKKVTAVVELQARFDEEANIYWSKILAEEGVKVIYGVPGLKVHAKIVLIKRIKNNKMQKYACIGSGNFNEDNAKVYTDHLFMTSDTKITNEVTKIFSFLEKNYKRPNYYHLIVAPIYSRNRISRLINNEIQNARDGKEAFIHIKLNNLVDKETIQLLYKAANEGVDVRLNIRGMFSMKTGIDGISDKINAIGIVDRFLEHTRIMIFCNKGNEKYFITSGDLMTRSLERRVEVGVPIFDKEIQKELRDIFDIQWNDNVKARILDKNLSNKISENHIGEELRSQYKIYNYLLEKSNPKPGSK